jgi:hypothetical protein
VPLDFGLYDGVTGVLVVKRNALDQPGEAFGIFRWRLVRHAQTVNIACWAGKGHDFLPQAGGVHGGNWQRQAAGAVKADQFIWQRPI